MRKRREYHFPRMSQHGEIPCGQEGKWGGGGGVLKTSWLPNRPKISDLVTDFGFCLENKGYS